MADNKPTIVTMRGKAHFAKILGDPIPNFAKDGKEWKMALELPNKKAVDELKALNIGYKVKTDDRVADGKPHINFKQAELNSKGEPNKRIPVVDVFGEPWDQDKLIGNGSDVDVKFAVVDNGPGKKTSAYIRSVRVLKLVPYEGKLLEPLDEDDEFLVEARRIAQEDAKFREDFGVDGDVEDDLDDDIEEVL